MSEHDTKVVEQTDALLRGRLILICGKIASGKTTLAHRLAVDHQAKGAFILSLDQLMASLYPDEVHTLDDFRRLSARVREAIGPHVVELLRIGLIVILDFPANTPEWRAWMRLLAEKALVRCELHYLKVSDEVCKERLRRRNAQGNHPYLADEQTFDLFTRHFLPPSDDEGIDIQIHQADRDG